MMLVFGKTGQVARELQLLAPDARYVSRDEVDLAKPTHLKEFLSANIPSAIINAAAYTAVDRAEVERDIAMAVNGASVGTMAEFAASRDIPFIHISTDYVFDGSGDAPHAPDDPTNPLGVYGHSKLAGEALTRNAGGRFAILRTSWVFSAHGGNFLKTMLRLGRERDHLTIVADQIGGPTPADGIAQACLTISETLKTDPSKAGVYHFAGAPDVSWADFAREIFTAADLNVTVEDIPSSDYPTPAARPLNSRLDCASLSAQFGIKRPDWQAATQRIVKELSA